MGQLAGGVADDFSNNPHVVHGYSELVVDRTDSADSIDVALLNAIMPRKNGPVVCDHTRAKGPELPILFATGYGFNVFEIGSLPKDDVEVVQKPYSAGGLLAKIRSLIER